MQTKDGTPGLPVCQDASVPAGSPGNVVGVCLVEVKVGRAFAPPRGNHHLHKAGGPEKGKLVPHTRVWPGRLRACIQRSLQGPRWKKDRQAAGTAGAALVT
mgnify:CR=1 FL=1